MLHEIGQANIVYCCERIVTKCTISTSNTLTKKAPDTSQLRHNYVTIISDYPIDIFNLVLGKQFFGDIHLRLLSSWNSYAQKSESFKNKMKIKKYHTVGKVPKYNRKFVERGKTQIPQHTCINYHTPFWHGTGTSNMPFLITDCLFEKKKIYHYHFWNQL